MIENILITGATSGLGYALAKRFADLNCKIYAVGRNEVKLAELAAYSEKIQSIHADINNALDRASICNQIIPNEPISIIHNAALAEPCILAETTESELLNNFQTNCISPTLLTKELLPHLQQGQRVLNISSGAAEIALPGLSAYCGTKAAFQMMMSCFNVELAEKHICFANLRPGMVDTPLQKRWRETNRFFPNQEVYINAEKDNKLIQPHIAAKFIGWVLLNTEDEDFKNKKWNIYDETDQAEWLKSDNLYQLKAV